MIMTNYNNIIKRYENIALSNFDILKLLNDNVNIVLYPNLINYDSIDQVLGPNGACILLFEAKPKYGHWCALFKQGPNLLEFFNPYGGYPDDSLKYIPLHYRKISNQLRPYLSELMIDSPYELSYNEFPFQKHKADIRTCGRHCVVRLLKKNLTIYQYKDFLDDLCSKINCNYDQLVTLLTINK